MSGLGTNRIKWSVNTMCEDYDVYQYDEWYWDSIPYDDIYDTAEELELRNWDE